MTHECQCCYITSTKPNITCSCEFETCYTCAKRFILENSGEASCMNCSKQFDRSFLCQHLGVTWVNTQFKKHQARTLLEKEMAKLPITQAVAQRERRLRELREIYRPLHKEKLKLRDSYCRKSCELTILPEWEREKRKELKQELKQVNEQCKTRALECRKLNEIISVLRNHNTTKEEKVQFVKKCPVDSCNGSLSTQWKCGMCDTFACSKCHTVIGKDKKAEHTCNPEDLESVKEIKKSTRPCPGCGSPVFKIEGCDQMFCTVPGCETAFSFRTGRKEHGIIHNPHYYQMKQQGLLGGVNRNPGDRVCGGINEEVILYQVQILRQVEDINEKYYYDEKIPLQLLFEYLYRSSIHFDEVVLDRLRTENTTVNNNEDLRIKYLLKDIDRAKFESLLARRIKKRQYTQEFLNIAEIMSTVLLEQVIRVQNIGVDIVTYSQLDHLCEEIIEAYKEVQRVREYCNQQLAKICSDFKIKRREIPKNITGRAPPRRYECMRL